MFKAAERVNANRIIRITGDCPLISPEIIDTVAHRHAKTGADYCSNIIKRTFPRGLDVEIFTLDSFATVAKAATIPEEREHVTLYYHNNSTEFDLINVTSDEIFDEPWMQNRTDLRLTLDEADDYELLRKIYENVVFEDVLDVRDAIQHVDECDLSSINEKVSQKTL